MNFTISGSDIPIILGISPFAKREDLILIKAGVKKPDYNNENINTRYGEDMEPIIREYVNVYHDMDYITDRLDLVGIVCKVDGIDKDRLSILEVKTTGKYSDNLDNYTIYLVQLLYYMMCYSHDDVIYSGKLAIYNRPDDYNRELEPERLQIFNINLKEHIDLCNRIREEVIKFRTEVNNLIEQNKNVDIDLLQCQLNTIFEENRKYKEALEKIRGHVQLIESYSEERTVLAQCNLIEELLER